jgi:nucleoid-associated protein EbfC
MTGFGDMMKQLHDMQEKMQQNMQKMEQELTELSIHGSAGAGLVKIVMNGRHDVKQVQLDPSLRDEDFALIEDLIAAAINDCVRKVDQENKSRMSNLAGGVLPGGVFPGGFKMPF